MPSAPSPPPPRGSDVDFITFVFIVLLVLVGLAVLAAGIIALPFVLLLGALYLVFAYPAVGIPVAVLGAILFVAGRAKA